MIDSPVHSDAMSGKVTSGTMVVLGMITAGFLLGFIAMKLRVFTPAKTLPGQPSTTQSSS